MLTQSVINLRSVKTRLLLGLALAGCLAWLAFTFCRRPALPVVAPSSSTHEAKAAAGAGEQNNAPRQMQGEEARVYLEQTSEGQSLMKALEAERFGLKWQERAPFRGVRGGGYLGMSHDENLNAWFDNEGVTIRPTLSEKERSKAWRLEMRLKAYGYGEQLQAAPAITGHKVKENRIEYERAAEDRVGAGLVPARALDLHDGQGQALPLQTSPTPPAIVEWYENKSAGIEQGFTLNARPARSEGAASDEPLRLVVSVGGDLRANASKDGQTVELRKGGRGLLNYSRLVATDARGRRLAARMETNAAGDEVALVVSDEGAEYPIVVDPITATLEKKLDADSFRQLDARFGFSVAISSNKALVGAWREDVGVNADAGAAYFFIRSGPTWSAPTRFTSTPAAPGNSCGWSVAISGFKGLVGCPGTNNSSGEVYFLDLSSNSTQATIGGIGGGRLGASVATDGVTTIVGEPLADVNGHTDAGRAVLTRWDKLGSSLIINDPFAFDNDQFGTSVAVNGDTLIAGEPNRVTAQGRALIFTYNSGSSSWDYKQPLTAKTDDGQDDYSLGDNFGNSVDVWGDTVVVGSPFDDNERGVDAGSAYVFVRGSNGLFSQQKKLLASDGRADDHFSEHAVAIEGNTIVVGAQTHDLNSQNPPFNFSEDRGAVYLFTRSGTIWTQQTEIQLSDLAGGEASAQFGIGVDISNDSVIIGARAASAQGTTRAGAAWVYRLDCVPPIISVVIATPQPACPGSNVFFGIQGEPGAGASYQWRKDGTNIPGANSASYEIKSVSPSDAGSYDVIVSNSCGSMISNAVTLNVYTFSLNPTSQNFSASGSNGIVNVTSTGSSCGWTAASNASWITITSGSSGTGNGTVGFSVAPNTGPQRTGTLTIAGQTFTVTQDGQSCSYSINPTSQSFASAGGTGSVGVTTGTGCAWAAGSNASWLNITSGASGTGSGTVGFSVQANTTTSQRTGTLTVAGQTFTVTQAGSAPPTPTVQLSQTSYSVSEGASFASITVTRTDTSTAATVKYQTTDSTDVNFQCNPVTAGQITGVASRKCDYHIASGRLRFSAGETTKQITLSIIDDVYVEGSETFNISLSNPTGMSLGSNTSATVTITDNDLGGAANPIDGTRFYVRQLYVDLLSREPDQAGWDGWTSRIDLCGQPGQAPPPCDRVTVGGDGFLRSSEFFDRQFFVLRLYKTAFGRILQYSEVGDLAYVSGFLSPSDLELNKQELVTEIMTRQEFTNRYGGLGDQAFVDTLLQTAGVTLSSADRNALITSLGANTKTRAQVFREVSERPEVSARHLVESQVVSAYYGFFTRNPDGAYTSYLNRLNTGEINLGDLANAFINAAEYRQRFGP